MTSAQGGSGFSVAVAQLRAHAGVCDQVANTLGQASDAAKQVTIGDAAFGQLPVASSFASLVRMVSTPGVDALSQAQASMSSTGSAIAATADNYETVEQGNTSVFTTIDGDTGTYTPIVLGANAAAVVPADQNGGVS